MMNRNVGQNIENIGLRPLSPLRRLAFIAFGIFACGKGDFVLADDYVLDPAPKEMIDWNLEEYQEPQDKEVCSLYLKNLRYFAQRNEPLSCGQPIAPMLKGKIKKVEWENLDSDQYLGLYKEINKAAGYIKDISQEGLDWRWHEVREGGVVFRRLKFDLSGYPDFERGSNRPLSEQEFSIVQFGNDVTSPDNPQTTWRCHPREGRIMAGIQDELELFIVTKDLTRIYSGLYDWKGYSGQNLWLINDHIYGEFYDEKGDIKLTELRVTFPIHLEPVCLYHFKKTSHNPDKE